MSKPKKGKPASQRERSILLADAKLTQIKRSFRLMAATADSAGDTLSYEEAAQIVWNSAAMVLAILGKKPKPDDFVVEVWAANGEEGERN